MASVAGGLPEQVKPLAHVLVAGPLLDGPAGIRRAIRARSSEELRAMAAHLARCARDLPNWLDALGLPRPDGSGFWAGEVLPAIKTEMDRRGRKRRLGRRSHD